MSIKNILTAAAATLMLFTACGKQESMDKLTARVFDVAKKQATLMAERMPADSMPRYFQKGKPINSNLTWWCSGFYPGSLWYIYEYTGDSAIKKLAEEQTLKLAIIAELPDAKTHHDVGFMLNCSYGNGLRLTGEKSKYEPTLEKGAAKLARRFNPVTGCIKSWNGWKGYEFPVIIDNMMNLELLMNAANLFNCDSLRTVACTHANTTMANHFRPDYTTWHVLAYDPADGNVLAKKTAQGYSDDSAWGRGQAWAVYGYSMMYRESKNPAYLAQAENIARMILKHLPADGVTYWDFDAPGVPGGLNANEKVEGEINRDASAAAIMVSAFIEIADFTADAALSAELLKVSETILRTLASPEYLAKPGENGNFLLKHSVGSLPGNSEVDVPLTYADYYYLEALLRFKNRK